MCDFDMYNLAWSVDHWNGNVIMLMKCSSPASQEIVIFFYKFSSLAASEVIKMTTSSESGDEFFNQEDNISVSVMMLTGQQWHITGLVVDYGISNTSVLEMP